MNASSRLIGTLVLLALLVIGSHYRDLVSHKLLFAVEGLALLLLAYGLILIRRMRRPLDFLQEGLQQLRQSDFATRYREPGLPELDELMGVYNELVERLQRERLQLGEALGMFQSLLNVTGIGVVIFDFDGHPRVINPAARRWLSLADDALPESLENIDGDIADALVGLGVDEESLITVSGGKRLRLRHGSFRDRGFERSYFLIQELTRSLEQSERDVSERLIRAIAHEVNNTLGAGDSLLECCLEDVAACDSDALASTIQRLDLVRERNRRLVSFVKRYARLVRLRKLDAEPTDLGALSRVAVESLRPALTSAGVTVVEHLPESMPLFELDGDLMQQALSNVLLNALEACSEGDTITVEAKQEQPGTWVLQLRDTANALASEADAFKPFHTTKPEGQGIGLMLVREILRRHQIEHSLTSAENQTVFSLEMPRERISLPLS